MRALPVVFSMFLAASAYAQDSAVVYTPRERNVSVPTYGNASLVRARSPRPVGQAGGTVSILGSPRLAAVAPTSPVVLGTAPCDVPDVVSVRVAGTSAAVVDRGVVTLTSLVSPFARVIPSLPPATTEVSLVAPTSPLPTTMPAGLPGESPQGTATRAFDAGVRTLALKANEIDMYWSRYSNVCVRRTAVNPGDPRHAKPSTRDRGWFALFSNDVPAPDEDDCRRQNVDLSRMASDWRDVMSRVDDGARQNGVLPGTMREIRERYRVDY